MAAAEALLVHCPHSAWDRLWPVIRADSGFGRDLFEQVVHFHDECTGGLGARLAENEVADLYLWLAAQFQRIEQDGKQAGGPWIRPPEYAGSVAVTMLDSGSSEDGTVNRSDEHDHCAVRSTTPTERAMWLTETLAAASDRGPESSTLFHICMSVGSLCALRDHAPPAEVTKRWMARAKPLLYS